MHSSQKILVCILLKIQIPYNQMNGVKKLYIYITI